MDQRRPHLTAVSPNAAEAADHEAESTGPSLVRAAQLTALAGVIHSLLFLVSFWLATRTPGANASDADLVAFYTGAADRRPVLIGLYLMPIAGIAFIWFADALRVWGRGRVRWRNQFLSTMQFIAGILYVGLLFATSAAYTVTAASVEFGSSRVDPMLARLFPEYGRALFFFFVLRMAAVFAFTTSNLLMKSGILPKWLGWIGIAVGVILLLTPTFSDWLALIFPVWVLILCASILVATRHTPATAGDASRGSYVAAGAVRHEGGEA